MATTDNPSGRKEIKVAMTLTELGEIKSLVSEQQQANKILDTIGGSMADVAAALKDLAATRAPANISAQGTHPPAPAQPGAFFGSGGPQQPMTEGTPAPIGVPVTPTAANGTGGAPIVPRGGPVGAPQFVDFNWRRQLSSMVNPAQYGGRYTGTQALQQIREVAIARSQHRLYDPETQKTDYGVEMNPDHIDPVNPARKIAHEEFFNEWSNQSKAGTPQDRRFKVFVRGDNDEDVRFGSEISDAEAAQQGYKEQDNPSRVREALMARSAIKASGRLGGWGTVSKYAGRAAGIGTGIGLGAMAAQALYSTAQRVGQSGIVSGYSREGQQLGFAQNRNPFSIGAGEEESIDSRIQAFTASWGGLNPFLSGEQAAAARNAVHGLGYSGGERDRMVNSVNDLTQYTGLDPNRSAEMLDRAYRGGSASIEGFRRTLEGLPAAAQAARMSVGQLQESLDAAAQRVSQTTGMPYAKAAETLQAQVAGTGMRPGAFESQTLDWMGAARSGVSIGKYLLHPEIRAAGNIDAATYYLSQLGGDMNRLRDDPHFQEQLMGNLSMSGGVLPGTDLNFEDLLRMANDPEQENRVRVSSTLGAYAPDAGNIVKMGGIGDLDRPGNRDKYDTMIRQQLKSAGVADRDIDKAISAKDPTKALDNARRLVGDETNEASGKARDNVAVSLAFAPGVEDILRAAINGGEGNDKYGEGKRTFVPSATSMGNARSIGRN
jgi:hypothetical protein